MEVKKIQEIEEQIIEEFSIFDDWDSKYEYIIELGKKLPLIDTSLKNDAHKVSGCQSQVWVNAEFSEGKIVYKADSDAIITKGLIALMIRVLSNHTPAEILNSKLEFIDRIGMKEHLSMNRANGLVSMIQRMKDEAKKFENN